VTSAALGLPRRVDGAGRTRSRPDVLLLDGIRVSSPPTSPADRRELPVHTARQIEIVYGPASALYGAERSRPSSTSSPRTRGSRRIDGRHVGWCVRSVQSDSVVRHRLGANASLVSRGSSSTTASPISAAITPPTSTGCRPRRRDVSTILRSMTPSPPVSPDYHIPISARRCKQPFAPARSN